mgnify:CR=1 FL=1
MILTEEEKDVLIIHLKNHIEKTSTPMVWVDKYNRSKPLERVFKHIDTPNQKKIKSIIKKLESEE